MPHLHLQIQFGSDFEGYSAGSIPPACPPPQTPPSFILASSYTWDIMQIFVKSECDYVGEENECWNVRYAFDLISGSLKLDTLA